MKCLIFLFFLVILSQAEQCNKQCKIETHVQKSCQHNKVSKALARDLDGSKDIKEVQSKLLKNGEDAQIEIQQLLTALEEVAKDLPKIAKALKKELKDCIDGSKMDFSDDICRVPSEEMRQTILDSHNTPPYIAKALNTRFGSMMPTKAIDTLLKSNMKRTVDDLKEQQEYLDHCLQNVDYLSTSIITFLDDGSE